MPSLQLLQLTEHGRGLLASRKRTLAVVSGALVAGGALAYARSGRRRRPEAANGGDDDDTLARKGERSGHSGKDSRVAGTKRRKSALKSLHFLAAILLKKIGPNGTRYLLGLMLTAVLRTAVGHRLAKVQGYLFKAAFLRRVPTFTRLIVENLILCFLQSAVYQTSKYLTGSLNLRFKKILTDLVHADYFQNMVYYKISHVDHRISNPEQRIASDIPKFCSELSELVQDDLAALAEGLIYTWRLCSYASPKYMLWILAYILVAGGAIRNFSPAFGKLKSTEQHLEGEYRQLHSRLRTHAESVAFYGGEKREAYHIMQRFQALVGHLKHVLHENWWFGMIQDFFLKYFGATVAVVLIIEPFFSGDLRPDSSTLGRADMLSNLRYHTSVIISLFQSLGTLSISTRRLNILRDFTLISGPNGSGKSSLFRVLGGLWPLVSGHIVKPGVGSDLNKEIFYVPQRPYTAVGTLREQLIYPLTADQEIVPLSYDGMVDLLKNVDLEYLLERYPLDKEVNWGNELSLGEQQRLGMARLFYHKPKFAILDECTSAVTIDMEERFCKKVRAMGTSCITISHRPALVAFHNIVLSLDGEGGWDVQHRRFTWRMKLLSGRRGVGILYAYMLLGLGFLRAVSPDFGHLASEEQELEGTFRFMHSRLRTHAESIAFFGGGSREKAMVEAKFMKLQNHSKVLLRKQWLYGIVDDFVTKQLPHNVTWGLSLLYALEHKGDRALTSTQGELAHALRFLASVVSQSFVAFGDILELHKKFLELSGGINRIFELEEVLHVAQRDTPVPSSAISEASEEIISFHEVDIVTPSQKLLASKLSCNVVQGKSLLLTGPNGTGKSSVFRVLRDLWPAFSGRVTKPSEGMFHVPQSPYTSLGTLRDQVIYPLSREEAEMKILSLYKAGNRVSAPELLDDHLKTVLVNVRLVYLLEREGWDSTPNWEDVLSLGEQQRLGMARLFFHHPKFGILDECTNATSVDVEEHLYRLATDMGITVITSSQRPALIPFHSVELKLIDGEGNWELCEIQH
uniref:Uncharacterized protein n=1 Tax=Avena sativa TaxID=4498 RepID=A0ACD5ZKT0_AVESA